MKQIIINCREKEMADTFFTFLKKECLDKFYENYGIDKDFNVDKKKLVINLGIEDRPSRLPRQPSPPRSSGFASRYNGISDSIRLSLQEAATTFDSPSLAPQVDSLITGMIIDEAVASAENSGLNRLRDSNPRDREIEQYLMRAFRGAANGDRVSYQDHIYEYNQFGITQIQ